MGRPNIATYADRVHLVMNLDVHIERIGAKSIIEALVEDFDRIELNAENQIHNSIAQQHEIFKSKVQKLESEVSTLREENRRLQRAIVDRELKKIEQ